MEEMTPEELLEYVRKNRWFNINKEDVGDNLVAHGIASKREKDDIAYHDPVARVNIRRGLTLIETLKNFKRVELKVARKGLRKFEYLHPEFLVEDAKMGKQVSKLKDEFLKSVDRFKGTFKVNVIEKLNGENCQISFSCNSWVICSKNRVLFIKKDCEIPWKDRSLHGFRLEIAASWFDILKAMTPERISQLQKQLETKTLIGEYCDSINHQHIVKYHKQSITFYSVVDKNSSDNCLLVEESYKIFEEFGLSSARILIEKEVESSNQLSQFLDSVYKTISKASIEECGEGAVVYIEGRSKQRTSVISLMKVKSVEYLILRRLREKVLQYLKKYRKSPKNILKKYKEEIQDMAKQYKPHQELEQYNQLGEKAFRVVEDGSGLVLKFVVNKFISFMEFLKETQPNPKEAFDKLINQASKELSSLPEQEQQVIEEGIMEKQSVQDQPEIQEKQEKPALKVFRKRIVILIPLTIPSSGKTTIFKEIQDKDIQVEIVSSDDCRDEIMKELKLKFKNATHQELFDKSAKAARTLFYKSLSKAFNKLEASKTENCLLLLDKNHPSNSLPSTMKQLQEIIGNNKKNVKIVALTPLASNPLNKKGEYSYPFSVEYLVTCAKRVIHRAEHQTLIGDPKSKVNVVVSFFNMFRGFRFNKYNLGKYFDGALEVKMFNEDVPKLTEDHRSLIIQILTSGKPGSFEESPYLDNLIQDLEEVSINEIPLAQLVHDNTLRIREMFDHFDELSLSFMEEK